MKSTLSTLQRFKAFYIRALAENRTPFYLFLGFVIVPIVGITLLYMIVCLFWI